jgi:hypothetical protein
MEELGYETWSEYTSIIEVPLSTTTRIQAFNEHYFLYDISDVETAFTIRSDNDFITNSDFIVTGSPVLFPVFSGNITITNKSALTDLRFVFIQVIPDFN